MRESCKYLNLCIFGFIVMEEKDSHFLNMILLINSFTK